MRQEDTIMTSVQHCSRSPRYSDKTGKTNKGYTSCKRRNSIVMDNKIFYIENVMEPTICERYLFPVSSWW